MSADKTPGKQVTDSVKDAEVVSSPSDQRMPTSKPITFGQQIFIWSMVLLVGVIFGVGSSWTFLEHAPRSIGGISENDIIIRKDVAENLSQILAGARERFAANSYEGYAEGIRLARYAASQGLMPEGADLDGVTEEFLARTLPGGTRTYRDLLAEHYGSKIQVSRPQLRHYLAERAAIEGLYARHLAAPAVPLTVADDIERLLRTRITADQVVLTATHLLQPVTDTDPEIQTTYEKLRATRFTRRAQVTVNVAAADLAALAAKAVIADSDIAARYNANKESYRKPIPPGTKADAPAEYKSQAEVSAEIKAALAREQAEKSAQAQIAAFNAVIEEKDLERADAATFAAAATAAGLAVNPALIIPEAQGGMVDLGTLGLIKDPAGIFNKDPGFITNPLQAAESAAAAGRTWFVLRVVSKAPAGFKALDEVKAEVKEAIAGTRAYAELIKQAEALRVAAEKAGPGGLKKLFADAAQAAWKTTVTDQSLAPLTEINAPATEQGGAAGEAKLIASMTLPERPVALAEVDGDPSVPSVRLLQIRELKNDTTNPPSPAERMADAYRQALTGYRQAQFDRVLRDQLAK